MPKDETSINQEAGLATLKEAWMHRDKVFEGHYQMQ
jgi:hypothetical protein